MSCKFNLFEYSDLNVVQSQKYGTTSNDRTHCLHSCYWFRDTRRLPHVEVPIEYSDVNLAQLSTDKNGWNVFEKDLNSWN